MLADILANSVALLIILITITISIKHETEQKRLEQVEDVAVLLSREIARSVVVNALPTSSPAMLHDYETSPMDRNPRPDIMPIIELRRGYVRNYYTNEIFPRDELLLQDNRFDRYLRSLPRPLLLRTRVDIYSIDLFYIVMSILKSYNMSPRHWHFLAEPANGAKPGGMPQMDFAEQIREDAEKPGAGDGDGNIGESKGGANEENTPWSLPGDAAFDMPSESGAYPRDAVAYGRGNQSSSEEQPTLNLPGAIGQQQNKNVRESDELFEALSDMVGSSMQEQEGERQKNGQMARFRTASNEQEEQQDGQNMVVQLPHLRLILPALFAFMEQAQATADTHARSLLAKLDIMQQLLPLVTRITEHPDQKKLFDRIAGAFENIPGHKTETIRMRTQINAGQQKNIISLPVNQRITAADLIGNEYQTFPDNELGERNISSRLSLYPAIYQGIRSPLRGGMMALMPPGQKDPEDYRWRVVTFVSPQIDDWVIAFIYSAIGDNGQLLIATDENVVELDDSALSTHYPNVPLRGSIWAFILYGVTALLIALGIFKTFRRTA